MRFHSGMGNVRTAVHRADRISHRHAVVSLYHCQPFQQSRLGAQASSAIVRLHKE
jgi:hypothetical protein